MTGPAGRADPADPGPASSVAFTVEQVADGIHLITLPYKPLGSVNVYVLSDADGLALIDTGPASPEFLDAITEAVARVDPAGIAAVHTICLTHSHTDHIGHARDLQDRSGAACLLHPHARDFFTHRYTREYDAVFLRWLDQHGLPPQMRDAISQTLPSRPPLPVTSGYGERLPLGDGAWEVVDTGGHAPGHVSFVDRDRGLLLCGDAVMERHVPLVDIQPSRGRETMREYLDGLNRLRDVGVEQVLPAHGRPFAGLERRIDELQTHHRRRMEQIRSACRTRWCSAFDLCMSIWAPTRRLKTRMTLSQTVGYLGHLEIEGHVRSRTAEGVVRWRTVGT